MRRAYVSDGYVCIAQRWRGQGGEVDLILKAGEGFVFVEVKKSKSFASAALRLSTKQRARIVAAAQEFVATQPNGLLSEMRFDVALVDGAGRVERIENALWDS